MSGARRHCPCGTLLARDNVDSLCSPCERRRRLADGAPDVPPEFWRTALMGAALASGDLGRALRLYRFHPMHGRPLSQALVARWLHVSQSTLSRIENGQRRLTIDDIAEFASALGMPMPLRWTALHDTGEDVDPLSRRSLFGAGVGTALGLNATTAPPAAARDVDPELVTYWMRLLRVLGCHDAMFGPHEVLDVVEHQIGMMAAHRQPARGELRRELLSVESRWAWLASWLSNDSDDWRRRDVWADRSLQLAQHANDPDMVAWSLIWQSRWAAMRHDARAAIALANAAQRTPGAADKLRGLGALKEAHGHAVAGDVVSCERRLADAHRRLERGDPMTLSDDLGRRDDSIAPYVPADEARCWLVLRPQKAVAMLEGALRTWPPDRTRGLGVQQARLALAYTTDDLDRAAVEGMKAVEMARATKSDMTVRELKRLDHQLSGCDLPAAAEFREAFAAL